MKLKLVGGILGGALLLAFLHIWINVGFDNFVTGVKTTFGAKRNEFVVGFLPVTCHLTCPVVDWTTRHSASGAIFSSKRYSEFPTMCEDLTQGTLQAAFLNAPLTISLVQKGVKVKLVSLGHRDGSAIVVPTKSDVTDFKQLKGKKILIPSKFSNQQLWLARLCSENSMPLSDLNMVVCPPPDMPGMLEAGNCDAYVVGEPHAARSEMSGAGRVLLQVKDSWPNFVSCALVVREDAIAANPDLVQELVDGINGSGLWLEQGLDNRMSAAEVVGKYYYNQKPELLKFVLSKPIDRVRYTNLAPNQADFDTIMKLGIEVGMFKEPLAFDKYVDPSFSAKVPNKVVAMPPDDGKGVVVAAAAAKPAAPPAPAPAAPNAPANDQGQTKK